MITTEIKGIELKFNTLDTVFSPKHIDTGTLAMLSEVDFEEHDKVLDLGCGYGVVGILAAKLIGEENVIMIDISEDAVKVAKENGHLNHLNVKVFQSNAYQSLDEKDFTLILSNPPYHSDFSVAKEFIEKGFNRLKIGGNMVMVTKRRKWYKNKFISIFGGVKIIEKDGYYVFIAEKRSDKYAKKR